MQSSQAAGEPPRPAAVCRPSRLVSGGQTGVDRAALDVARALGVPCGGWCPAGRWAEDGPIPPDYPLLETPSPDPDQRTEWNVRDSDGTLVLLNRLPSAGTSWTITTARRQHRPLLIIDLDGPPRLAEALRWIADSDVRVLNVAGPRESEAPGIYRAARDYLLQLFGVQRESRACGS